MLSKLLLWKVAVEAAQQLLLVFSPFWCEVLHCYAPALRV
jgi:hypothetical protein